MPSLSNSYSTVHWQSLDIQFYNFSKHVLKLLPPASMIFFSIKSASVCLCCVNAILSVKLSGLKTGHCKKKMNKTRVLLCKRLSGQCIDVCMVVYFHLHWWWWAVVDCAVLYWAVLGCTGLYWAELGCTGLYWSLLGWIGLWWAVVDWTAVYCTVLGGVNSYLSVYSAIFGMVTNDQTNNQVNLEQACSWPVWEGSLLQFNVSVCSFWHFWNKEYGVKFDFFDTYICVISVW